MTLNYIELYIICAVCEARTSTYLEYSIYELCSFDPVIKYQFYYDSHKFVLYFNYLFTPDEQEFHYAFAGE